MIRVVGVGGAGVNAINRMVEAGIPGVEFLAVNTDLQSLQQSNADVTVHLGSGMARGLGAGSDPELGYRAAFEEQDKIKRLLKGTDMVFVTCGAGGGTGTGAAPVIARLARDVGALTVGIVTKPFRFEGSRRGSQAEEGVQALGAEVDTLIVVPNERLLTVLAKTTTMVEAFQVADDVLRQGVQGISELITLPGMINLDFADVRTTMRDAGHALLGIGMGAGDNRAVRAAESAVSSPLLETSVDGARSILLSITGGSDLTLLEVSEAAKIVQEAAHPDANIIFGANIDDTIGDEVWITVIATRFDERAAARGPVARAASAARSARPDGRPAPGRAPRRHREATRVASPRLRARRARVRPWPLSARGAPTARHHHELARRRRCRPSADRRGRRAQVLREGGNAVDAAVAAVMTSFVTESPLTGLGAGGYMLVHTGAETVRARLLRRRPGRRRRIERRSELVPIPVHFTPDSVQVFHVGAASCGVPGTPGGLEERVAQRSGPCRSPSSRRRRSRLAREGVVVNGEQAYFFAILAPILTHYEEAREHLRAGRRRCSARATCSASPSSATRSSGSAPRAPSRSTAARSRRRSPTGCSSAAARSGPPTSPPTSRSPASRSRRVSRAARCSPTRRPSSGGILIAFALELLDAGARCRIEEIVAAMEAAQRAHGGGVPRRALRGRLRGALPRRRPARLDHPHHRGRRRRHVRERHLLERHRLGADRPRRPASTSTTCSARRT